MRRQVRAVFFLLIFAALALAPRVSHADPIRLDPVADGILLGSGIVLAGATELLLPGLPPPWGSLGTPDISRVNALDRGAMFSYSHALDLASTVTEYTTFAFPLAFVLLADPADAFSAGVVYVEAVSIALGVKNLVNYLVPRYRPYMYEGGAPGVDPTENDLSFPSGHTTFSFAAATAGVAIFLRYSPDSPWFLPFALTSYGLATATASLRVLAGMHFVTDVVAGAVLGGAIGYLVPMLHDRLVPPRDAVGLRLNVDPREIMLSYRY
jgi:membrane-associated phospholipid phosphatase